MSHKWSLILMAAAVVSCGGPASDGAAVAPGAEGLAEAAHELEVHGSVAGWSLVVPRLVSGQIGTVRYKFGGGAVLIPAPDGKSWESLSLLEVITQLDRQRLEVCIGFPCRPCPLPGGSVKKLALIDYLNCIGVLVEDGGGTAGKVGD